MSLGERHRKTQERDHLIKVSRQRADRMIADAQGYAQSGNVGALERAASGLQTMLKSSELPRDLIVEYNRQINRIQLAGYKFYIDEQLAHARRMAQGAEERRKQTYIQKAREYLAKAMAVGAGEEFKLSVMKKIDIVEFTGNPPPPPQGTVAKPVEKNPSPAPNRAKS